MSNICMSYEMIDNTFGHWSESNQEYSINLSSIYTKLIQETGRFCERFASDVLYGIKTLESFMNETGPFEVTEFFGLRENGVDGFEYIMHNFKNGYSASYYRKIYAVKLYTAGDKLHAELLKVTCYKEMF